MCGEEIGHECWLGAAWNKGKACVYFANEIEFMRNLDAT
jgi:hypothetical protein